MHYYGCIFALICCNNATTHVNYMPFCHMTDWQNTDILFVNNNNMYDPF